MLPTVTSKHFQEAMSKFDLEMRDKYWRNWEMHTTAGYAIHYSNKYYPLRQIVSLINHNFNTIAITQLQDLARKQGFSVVQITRTPNTSAKFSKRSRTNTSKYVPFGNYKNEEEFETKFILPLIHEIGLHAERQVICTFYTGSKPYHGRIDMIIYRQQQALAIIECKKHVQGPIELSAGIGQAKSYALMSGINKFVLAAPQGMWCFQLERHQEKLMTKLTARDKKLLAHKLVNFLSENYEKE